jgi:uncharacterized RDD family membrane protein YckC
MTHPKEGPVSLPFENPPPTPEQIASRYDSSIVVRRWGATWIDFLVLIAAGLPLLALPENRQGVFFAPYGLLVLAYFLVLEHLYGRTLGKVVCRVRIVGAQGGNPSWGQATLRTLLRLVEVNPALLGGIPAGIVVLASSKRQRLGDIAAGTFVLRAEDIPALSQPGPPTPVAPVSDMKWLLPVGRSGWSIAAGYLGLFSLLFLPAPLAVVAGILGLREIRRKPGLGGRGRAIFGIVMGALFSAVLVVYLVSSALHPE